jgi:isopropylmalate/homocitrate/citramalate synthase
MWEQPLRGDRRAQRPIVKQMDKEEVKLIECPRDAWQGLHKQIPTERKVQYLRALIAAGFRYIDAASFVSPKAIPRWRTAKRFWRIGSAKRRRDHRHCGE